MRALIAAALLAFATPALAAPVELPVQVADGANWTLEATRVRLDERKDGPRRVETTSRYDVTYRKADEGGLLILKLVSGSLPAELPAGMTLADFQTPMELEVDEALTPTRLRNWPQIRETFYRLVAGEAPQVRESMRSVFEPMSGEIAAALVAPGLTMSGLGQGLSIEPGAPTTYEDALPNPLGGPPIASDAQFVIERRDAKARQTVVAWKQTLNPQSLAASMRESAKALVARLGGPADEAKLDEVMRALSVGREDRCRFTIDERTGLAVRTECAVVIDINAQGEKGRRTDTWTITQTLPASR